MIESSGKIILTDFVKRRMAYFGFNTNQTLDLIMKGKKIETPGEVFKGFLKKDTFYIQSGKYFFQLLERRSMYVVIGLGVVVFTRHAQERMRSFRLSEEEVLDYLAEAIEMPEAMRGKTRSNYKNPDNKDKTYKFGPLVFGISEDRSDWVLTTVYDQRMSLPNYDPTQDPIYKKKL